MGVLYSKFKSKPPAKEGSKEDPEQHETGSPSSSEQPDELDGRQHVVHVEEAGIRIRHESSPAIDTDRSKTTHFDKQHYVAHGGTPPDSASAKNEYNRSSAVDRSKTRLFSVQHGDAHGGIPPDSASMKDDDNTHGSPCVDPYRSKTTQFDVQSVPVHGGIPPDSASVKGDDSMCGTIRGDCSEQPARPNSAPPGDVIPRSKKKRTSTVNPSIDDQQRDSPDRPPPARQFLPEASNKQVSPRGDGNSLLSSIQENETTEMSTPDDRESQHKMELKKKDDEIKSLMEHIQNMTDESPNKNSFHSKYRREVEDRDKAIHTLKARLREMENEKEQLLTRLSAAVGAKLTTNNPNIADLSDGNRPTKLAEQFSELYDNDWTDTFTALEEAHKSSNNRAEAEVDVEKAIVYGLVKMLTITYTTCKTIAEQDMSELNRVYQQVYNEHPTTEVLKQLMDKRKQTYKACVEKIKERVNQEVHGFVTSQWELKTTPEVTLIVEGYLAKCRELCWLMVIQDPPVYMDCAIVDRCMSKKRSFKKNLYREYTAHGKKIAFIVWPVLYLHKSGPILSKGVAQGKYSNKKPRKTSDGLTSSVLPGTSGNVGSNTQMTEVSK